jgi:hypothetical protein
MLKAAEGKGSSFRFGITKNDISINDYEGAFLPLSSPIRAARPEKPMSREGLPSRRLPERACSKGNGYEQQETETALSRIGFAGCARRAPDQDANPTEYPIPTGTLFCAILLVVNRSRSASLLPSLVVGSLISFLTNEK